MRCGIYVDADAMGSKMSCFFHGDCSDHHVSRNTNLTTSRLQVTNKLITIKTGLRQCKYVLSDIRVIGNLCPSQT